MNLINNNLSPLPFYDNLSDQNHKKDYAFGAIHPIVIYKAWLIPFQVVLSSGSAIEWVRLYDYNTNEFTDITQSMNSTGLTLKSYADFKILKYSATSAITGLQHEGLYYLAISITDYGIIYSDLFSSNNNMDCYLKLEYGNTHNLYLKNGMVDFSDNFKFRCYLSTQVGKPEYTFEEEATDRGGYSFIEFQVSKKIYKFTFLAPEYLCDALRIVRMCDSKTVTSKNKIYKAIDFGMEVSWEDQGDLASVVCEFETDNVISNIGGYSSPVIIKGDFDNDYNVDYNN